MTAPAQLLGDPVVSRPRRRRVTWGTVLTVVMAAVALIWLLPGIIVLITSVKPEGGLIGTDPLELPASLHLENYATAWGQADYSSYMINSAIICLVKVPLGLLVSSLTAFGLTRFRFRFRRSLFLLIVAGSMVPLQIPLIPLFTTLIQFKLLNSYVGLILVYIAFSLPFQVIFLATYFNQIPKEIEDAARVDGTSPWRYFISILLPLSKPILASLAILDLVGTWNELPVALTVLLDNDKWTVPLGLLSFKGAFSSQYTLISAAVVMAALPVVVIYVTLQRYFERGFVAGSLKG